ncbi:MAG: hypothetical protein CVT49_10250 [candidate division Zixibacteria bacterium HGW-Zixibacteria-1]|nr:MAG: hypothetical protein CVT49_10250 [candidate division Zixibacteria bacterium HGW-Zixibacteria-1]
MNNDKIPFHFVCTHDEAADLIKRFDRYWVSNCGCRESRGSICQKSRLDLCLMFRGDIPASGASMHEICFTDVSNILKEASSKHLVARPFRNEIDRKTIEGICFCCDDCCGYFTKPEEQCDKGALIEKTNYDICQHCGNCVEVCYFRARAIDSGELQIIRDNCYGCGLCVDLCPEEAIEMISTR